jgi:uncharacterized protein
MKNFSLRCFGTLLGLFFLLASAAPAAEKISEPFHYQGYSFAQYPKIEKSSAYVPLSDGNKLAVDIYKPAGGPETSFPVIVELTPYTRAYIDLNNGPLHRAVRKSKLKTTSPVLDMLAVKTAMGDQIKMVIGHGYVFVRADLRGCGASSGWKADFMPQMGKDGGELIDWIAKQPWCSGNVGMIEIGRAHV